MKALTFQGRERVSYDDIPDPRIETPNDAIVEVRQTAICGSDLHVYHERERGILPGTAMGHEFSGRIVAVGKNVRSLRVGDEVVAPFTTSCGDCSSCRRGLTARCAVGELFGWRDASGGLHGGQAELVRVPLASSTLVTIGPEEDPELSLFLGDILSTAYFCAEMAEVRPDGVYAVVGCGPVGLLSILCVRTLGAARIVAFDSIDTRLELARRFGAETVDISSTDPVETAQERIASQGFDGVLELVGSESASRLAFDLVRPGGTIAAAGVHTEPNFAFSPVEAYDKNVTYRAGRCSARYFMEAARVVARTHGEDILRIVSHRLPLTKGVEGYDMFSRRIDGCTKVVLAP